MKKLFLTVLLLAVFSVCGEVKLNGLFSDNAVLQRNKPIAVFGAAGPGEKVTVSLNGATAEAVAGKNGRFSAELPEMAAGGPYTLTVSGRDNTVSAENVMVGEVWLCSGQSNMWWTVELNTDGKDVLKACADPGLRLLNIPQVSAAEPAADFNAVWQTCDEKSLAGFSAVGYFAAKRLREKLNVPVGVINASWSGTRIEPWISPDAFLRSDDARWNLKKELLMARDSGGNFRRQLLENYIDDHKAWGKKALRSAKKHEAVEAPPAYPWQLAAPVGLGDPAVIWNGMVAPLAPYTIAGVFWYQGEANLWDAAVYGDLMKLWVSGWRRAFKSGDKLPFYFVQLAPFNSQSEPDVLPKMWECQTAFALKADGVEMVEINDTDSVDDIHPKDKRPVGRRLADKALKYTYGFDVGNVDSPRFAKAEFKADHAVLRFDNTTHLEAVPGGSAVFEIADAAGRWTPAAVEPGSEAGSLILRPADGGRPVAARYGWNKSAVASIRDAASKLPLGAFRCGRIPARGMVDRLAPQLTDYTLVYRFSPAAGLIDGNTQTANYEYAAVPDKPFSRVAVFAHLLPKSGGGDGAFVAIEMDAYAGDVSGIGLPTAGSGGKYIGEVKNVTVSSNVPGVVTGTFADGFNLECFPGNYTAPNRLAVPGASDAVFDFGDNPSDGAGYGSYQFHNFAAKQTVFAFNAWTNGPGSDIGIGSNPSGNPDWTFAKNAGGYGAAYILVLVK
ncbi:MAG: sialate O-acetylesterase [Victivallaceae bacterium]|nr:sialate O-acetylesterase [Victivallaceae bacterium]